MQVTVSADLSAVGRLAKRLEKADATRLRRSVRDAANGAGTKMLAEARSNASWSSKVPRATTLRTSFGVRSAGVTMKTDRKRVPYAYYYERGSKNSGGRYVKHPIYGSQDENARADVRSRYDNKATWRQTPTRPFFFKAGTKGREEFVKNLQNRLNDVIRELGYTL